MSYLPSTIALEPILRSWLLEDIGRGDETTSGLFPNGSIQGKAVWVAKELGVVVGLPIAAKLFSLLDENVKLTSLVAEGGICQSGQVIAELEGNLDALLIGERVALNLTMRLSGIGSLTRKYVDLISDLPTQLVDTRKTTPGLRVLEKYAIRVGGAINHRMGLDDGVMIKDNHIEVAGGIDKAIALIRKTKPYPLSIEVETTNLEEVKIALAEGADIIMLDNMSLDMMSEAVSLIRQSNSLIKIEASGNITLDNIRKVAETGVDYISSSAPITRSTWLDLSMKIV
jgi:nicotinate-nucleotide pyrophosphorylase (carboxylating)